MKRIGTYLQAIYKALERVSAISLVLITLAVLFAVTMVHRSSQLPNNEAYAQELRSKNSYGDFDQSTIDKIERLKAPDETRAINLPSGRINPFVQQ